MTDVTDVVARTTDIELSFLDLRTLSDYLVSRIECVRAWADAARSLREAEGEDANPEEERGPMVEDEEEDLYT